MRLKTYINEDKSPTIIKKLKSIVVECDQYFKEVSSIKKKPFVYRGTFKKLENITKLKPRTDRTPKDTSELVHNIMDSLLNDEFGWRPRSTGVFTGAGTMAGYYGDRYIFIPSNDYKYIWCPKKGYDDMYQIFDHQEYDIDFYESRVGGVWKSTSFKDSMFYDKSDIYMFMEKIPGYKLYISKPEEVVYKYRNTNRMIVFKWFEDDAESAKLAHQKVKDAIYKKGNDYVDHCIDNDVVIAIRTESPAEIMWKCDYYYMIDIGLESVFEEVINGKI